MFGNSREIPQLPRCWPWSRWTRPWPCSSLRAASTRLPWGQELGEGWPSTNTVGRLQNRAGSIVSRSWPLVGLAHQLCLRWGIPPPPGEATSCGRQPPGHGLPTGSNCCLTDLLQEPQVRAETLVAEGGITIREPALKAWLLHPSNPEATNGASKRVM